MCGGGVCEWFKGTILKSEKSCVWPSATVRARFEKDRLASAIVRHCSCQFAGVAVKSAVKSSSGPARDFESGGVLKRATHDLNQWEPMTAPVTREA